MSPSVSPATSTMAQLPETVMGRAWVYFSGHGSSTGTRLALIVALALLVHLTVKLVRHVSERLIHRSHGRRVRLAFASHHPKLITLVQLIATAVTFALYFFATGLVLEEFGVNLTGYLASASIIALAISFGSQGLVQDVVIGLTLIFSDTMDVGDMVEISGTVVVVGQVEAIGLRFTTVRNYFNQIVFIPNRTIANVSRFPNGGVFAYADIQIPAGADGAKAVDAIGKTARGTWAQFGAIILSEPVLGAVETARGGDWNYVRVQFTIWPGQNSLIETTFRQQVVSAMKTICPTYAEWQVPVTYRAMNPVKKAEHRPQPASGETPD